VVGRNSLLVSSTGFAVNVHVYVRKSGAPAHRELAAERPVVNVMFEPCRTTAGKVSRVAVGGGGHRTKTSVVRFWAPQRSLDSKTNEYFPGAVGLKVIVSLSLTTPFQATAVVPIGASISLMFLSSECRHRG
jgi:hypothetical protein